MDGSTASLIAIPIVVMLSLAAWLLTVAYAAAHPRWKHGAAAAGADDHSQADAPIVPAEPRLAHLAPADADQATGSAEPAKRAA
jgi:hypothetical protein